MELRTTQNQFNAAMELYTSRSRYKILGLSVSIITVTLQFYLLYRIWPQSIGLGRQVVSVFLAYFVADFINGLIHMYMDNNDRYDSLAGPLIANFHLHHKVPHYKKLSLPVVYFVESGSKVWLVGYLLLVAFLQGRFEIHATVSFVLVYIGILSSVAEVSHYLCHSSTSVVAVYLAGCGLLLPKRHHARHHLQDNCSYAFLNGVADLLLNLIAAAVYKGYKQNTDLHYARYIVENSEDR